MAIGASSVWEIRPTNGSNLNGGGFDAGLAGAGTDYSQQNAAQLSLTDLTTVGISATISSVTGGFTSAMVGNAIFISSGTNFTTGFYFIKTFVSSNSVTLDRNCATAAGLAGNGKVGGATKSISQQVTPLGSEVVGGNIVWIKNEAWSEQASITVTGSSVNGDIRWVGYNSTRGDAPTGSTRPTNNRASGAGGIQCNVSRNQFENLIVSNSSGIGFDSSSQINCLNCRATSNSSHGFNVGGALGFCESDGNLGNGVNATGTIYCIGNYFSGNLGNGFAGSSNTFTLIFNICANNFGAGINFTTGIATIRNNTLHSNGIFGTQDGLIATTPGAKTIITNNIFSNNTRYGVNMTNGNGVFWDYNDFFSNTTAARNNAPAGTNDLALDPQYKNASGGDFRIGVNLKAKGSPNTFPGLPLTVSYMDIGAVQRKEENQSVFVD